MVLGPFEKTLTMFLQILRTKRRAFALISGIMLGTMILSGIVLYSNVLQERNFESIVGNSPYEIIFDKFNGESMDSLRDLGENIAADPRIESWTEIGTIFSNNRNSILSASYQITPNDLYSEGEPGDVRPLFVSDTFFIVKNMVVKIAVRHDNFGQNASCSVDDRHLNRDFSIKRANSGKPCSI